MRPLSSERAVKYDSEDEDASERAYARSAKMLTNNEPG